MTNHREARSERAARAARDAERASRALDTCQLVHARDMLAAISASASALRNSLLGIGFMPEWRQGTKAQDLVSRVDMMAFQIRQLQEVLAGSLPEAPVFSVDDSTEAAASEISKRSWHDLPEQNQPGPWEENRDLPADTGADRKGQ